MSMMDSPIESFKKLAGIIWAEDLSVAKKVGRQFKKDYSSIVKEQEIPFNDSVLEFIDVYKDFRKKYPINKHELKAVLIGITVNLTQKGLFQNNPSIEQSEAVAQNLIPQIHQMWQIKEESEFVKILYLSVALCRFFANNGFSDTVMDKICTIPEESAVEYTANEMLEALMYIIGHRSNADVVNPSELTLMYYGLFAWCFNSIKKED